MATAAARQRWRPCLLRIIGNIQSMLSHMKWNWICVCVSCVCVFVRQFVFSTRHYPQSVAIKLHRFTVFCIQQQSIATIVIRLLNVNHLEIVLCVLSVTHHRMHREIDHISPKWFSIIIIVGRMNFLAFMEFIFSISIRVDFTFETSFYTYVFVSDIETFFSCVRTIWLNIIYWVGFVQR